MRIRITVCAHELIGEAIHTIKVVRFIQCDNLEEAKLYAVDSVRNQLDIQGEPWVESYQIFDGVTSR